jgi:anti-sigma factor RsiW
MNWTCEQTEERLSEHLDGLLGAAERSALEGHLEGCVRCRKLVAQVSGALAQVHRLEMVAEPSGLANRIIEQTLGPRAPKKSWFGWVQPMLQPRMALGFATVVLFGVVSLQAMGVEFSKFQLSDLSPKKLYYEGNRKVHLIYARGERFVNDLRVVYEIQSRLRPETEQQPSQPPPQQPPQNKPQDKPNRESNRLNEPACRLCMLTSGLVGVPARSLR